MIEEQVKDYTINNIDYGLMIVNIKDIMRKKDMSIYRLGKETGIKYHLLKKNYYNELYRIDLANVAKICYILNCKVSDIIRYIPPKNPF